MTLPINPTPVYTLTIPSTKQKVKYRPFLVKEEKALLIAQQSENTSTMIDTLRQVIASCVKDPIDVDDLASFDVEYIFTQLRAVSVGEMVELIFACDTCDDPKATVQLTINLNDMKVDVPEGHTRNIKLFDNVGVIMKYPNLDTLYKIDQSDLDDIDQAFDIMVDCVDQIYRGDELFEVKDVPREEVVEFLENLTAEQYLTIRNFFSTMPVLRHPVKYKCPVCDKDHNKYLKGLTSFF
jgi:hypothetical protein